MAKYRYKIIISNKMLYKEAELSSGNDTVRIGTTINCNVRLRKELFFEAFELTLNNDDGKWQITCSDNVYITMGDVRKLITKTLEHGDKMSLKYQSSDNDIFKISFMIDFDYLQKDYDLIIYPKPDQPLHIGGATNCSITLNSDLSNNEYVELKRENDEYVIANIKTDFGIYINGKKADVGSVIRSMDFLDIAEFSFYFKDNLIYTTNSPSLIVKNLHSISIGYNSKVSKYPLFIRNTRLKTQIDTEQIEILDPPQEVQKPKGNLLMQLFPALSMIFITVVIRGMMSSSSNSSFIIFSVCSMGVGIVTSAVTIITDKKQFKKDVADRIEKYQTYIAEKRKQIIKYREQEVKQLNDIYLDPNIETENVKTFSGSLFDRSMQDEDFLSIRLGTGDRVAQRKIAYKKQEKFATIDILAPLPEQVSTEYKNIHNAAIAVNLSKNNVIGVVGNNEAIFAIVKNIVMDISTRQYYKDVQLFFLIKPEDAEQYSSLRWLPHVYNEKLKIRNIVWDDDSKNIVFEYLYVELGNRSQTKNIVFPHIIVFVLNDWGIRSHPVSQYIPLAHHNSSTFVFCDNFKENIPQNCDELIILSDDHSGELVSCENKDNKNQFEFSAIDDETMGDVALTLSPIYCEEVSLESALTKNISLFELLNILTVDDLNLKERWNNSEIYKSMAAPLGVKTKNEIVYLDLHEKAHGPHGLVAGTTGSGKSEILQSYILSMATLFHPYEAGFVIIDFKGGGMVNQFKDLPHLVGAITNIDGREINRSLLSIKAELQKRQRLFAQYGVNNINNYIKLYKTGEISVPLPHLILVVDEFAELKAEQPDFMKELISAARIGRSLGVHLILATQKPSGQVNEQIWSNSKFKLCLKVQTKEDSNEVLKSPLAAEIKEPGRTYLQVGNNEIFELFQSAYSGAPAHVDDSKSAQEFSLYQVSLGGKRKLLYRQKRIKSEEVVATQLEAIVDYVKIHCEENNIEKLPDICLPPLPKVIDYPKEGGNISDVNMTVEIGIYDDPANQYQGKTLLDIANQNTVIIGSAQFGKTNLLQAIIRGLSNGYSPDDVNIYILDFGSMVLKNFEGLSHVGGVLASYEDEKLKNLFKLIYSEISVRKEKLLSIGVSSFASYREAGYKDLPHIVLIIDNFTALKELYLQEDDMLMPICRDGLSVGISVVLSNSQLSGLGYRYMTNFAKRIALYCNDASEYSGVIDRCRIAPANVVGRGLIEIDKEIFEFQSYLAFEGDKEIDRVNEMRQYIASVNSQYPGKNAKQIPEIPKVLEEEAFTERFKAHRKGTYVVPVGLDYESIDIVSVNLLKDTVISIVGRGKSGKSNFLSIIFNQLYRNMFDLPVKSYLADDVESGLRPFKSFGFVDGYSLDCNDVVEYVDEIYDLVKERYIKVSSEGLAAIEAEPLLLLVVQNRDAIAMLSKNAEGMKKYKEITGQYRSMKVCIIFSDVEDAAVSYSGLEIMKNIKERGIYYFNNLRNIKIYDVSSGTLKHFKKEIDIGDAYYLVGNEVRKIKTVKEGS